MSKHARVRSIDALSHLRAAIGEFAEEALQALISVDAEIARAQRATGDELPRYWQGELRRREEDVVRARIDLEQALARAEMGKSTVDERKALARAKQRVESARARIAATKRWSRELDREQLLYAGQVEPLARFARVGAVQASEALRAMIDALEQYVSTAPPTSGDLEPDDTEPGDVKRSPGAAPHAPAPSPPVEAGADTLLIVGARLPTDDQIVGALPDALDDLPALHVTIDERRRLASLASPDGPDPRAWLLVADTARHHERVALHRARPVAPADSGWRLVGLGEKTPEHWRQVPILTILRSRPALHDLLRLGPGWTVVIAPAAAPSIVGALDPKGTDRWSTIRGNPE